MSERQEADAAREDAASGAASASQVPLVSRLVVSLLAAATLEAFVEIVRLRMVGQTFATTEWLLLLLAVTATLTLASLPLLFVELVLLAGVTRLRARPQVDPLRAARLACALTTACASFLGLSWLQEFVFELHYLAYAYDRPADTALIFSTLHVLLTIPVLLLAALAGGLVWRLVGRKASAGPLLLRWLRLVLPLGLWAATYALVVRVHEFLPSFARAGATLGLLAIAQLFADGLWSTRRPARRRGLFLALGATFVAALSSIVFAGPALPSLGAALFEQSVLTAPALQIAGRWSDFDDDGQSSVFGATDCDGFDETIHAEALDVPGDGIDQNCTGRDARPARVYQPLRHGTPPNDLRVVWIVVDALRADRLGGRRSRMPNLDAFADGASRFGQARSQASDTANSFPSFLSSGYPSWVQPTPDVLTIDETLTVLLAERGYRTAFVSPLRNYPEELMAGFERVDTSLAFRRDLFYGVTSLDVTRAAETILREWRAERFFLLVHYYDPHLEYVANPAIDYGDRDIDRYDAEVSFTDLAIEGLLDLLGKNGFLDDTVVVVSADHGEAFGEHGRVAHGGALYDEQVRVPLVIEAPGYPARAIDRPVSLVDVVPTVLELLGVPDPGHLQGHSLVPLMDPARAAPAAWPVLLDTQWESQRILGVVDGGFKFILRPQSGVAELFDLSSDPGERTNLVARRGHTARRLRRLLDEYRDSMSRAAVQP